MSNTRNRGGLQARARHDGARRRTEARVVVTRPAAAAEGTATDDDTDTTSTSQDAAELWLYGTVGGYWWGFDSDDVAEALRGLGDVDNILVRLHSFGGSAIEGIAIANLLANHPARVRIVVDGLAASAASMIALAGDELVMSPGSQFMIHDAWTYSSGNAADLRGEAEFLDKQSQNYAETYAHRAGGTAQEWRTAMTANQGDGTWYTAAEAVAAGFAAEVANIPSSTPPPPTPDLWDVDDDAPLGAAASYDLELLHPAALTAWSSTRRTRAPQTPAASAPGTTTTRTEKETAMAFTAEQLTQMRQDLGLAETADEATIAAALTEALAEQADAAPANPTTAAPVVPAGMALVSSVVLDELRTQARDGADARAQQRTETRDRAVTAAVSEGRIAPAQRDHFASLYDADPKGTSALLAQLAPGLVPVSEVGHDQPPAADTHANTDLSVLAQVGLTEEDLR